MRGNKVGIIGPNASGKTTLIRLLLDEMTPLAGTIRHGTNLEVAYFDQLKATLDEDKTVQQNISDYDMIPINGQQRHVIGYLQDFLFAPERSRSLVKYLSGGERSRLLLARLFTKPSNLLVLDEPTNDLDVETLELLESLLVEYQGTVLLVSHDRAFLNDVVTSTLAIEADGRVREYDGGYDDYRGNVPPAAPRPEVTGVRYQSASVTSNRTTQKTELQGTARAGISARALSSSNQRFKGCTRRWPRPRFTGRTALRDCADQRPIGRARARAGGGVLRGGRLWKALRVDGRTKAPGSATMPHPSGGLPPGPAPQSF